jgi:hypothetical protein
MELEDEEQTAETAETDETDETAETDTNFDQEDRKRVFIGLGSTDRVADHFLVSTRNVKSGKEKVRRVVTDTKRWLRDIRRDILDSPQIQRDILLSMRDNIGEPRNKEHAAFVSQQVTKKISGYKYQDVEKNIFCEDSFVDYDTVISRLCECDLTCYYCRKPVLVLYEFVREPRQWTLERKDNAFGHNKDNIDISCLTCNIRRRTMLQERYVLTRRSYNIVKL